ncbi:ribonuclease domain-containing protein [Kutzneria sp. CA-103260]|uniref:ribonuclease domain-containing protein n=1 Tax=Kutzneria sp. CA-103260 TaxID=2802641 RepID=UPI001BA902BE|nr:ribonuclease domain-containing protein [Kutzneria sp. CA-103260]QUQ68021.1 guanine-specific ribonuclease N1 and T1 [Kutzneria sp. CA-103260]
MTSRRRITFALVGLIVLVLAGWLIRDLSSGSPAPTTSASATSISGKGSVSGSVPGAASGLPVKALSSLPKETSDTWKLIQQGGPFPYPKNDGVVFHNNGNVLPRNKDGYYHEYTVDTPGAKNRATRRLITGSQRELYYTDDHYDSFVVVDPTK